MTQTTEKKLFVKQLKPYLYMLGEAHESTGYLVAGEKKACLIDTMQGYNNLKEAVGKLTSKPLMVVNTHGHPDHIYGNVYFDEAYINPSDLPFAEEHAKNPEFVERCRKGNLSMPPFREIHPGDTIDLGGKTLEIYPLPCHTPGGILLLLKEDRILFTGDSVNHHLWLQLPESLDPEECVKNFDEIMFLENQADVILHGHAKDYDDISLLRCVRNGIEEICRRKTEKDLPYKWFGGTDLQHPFSVIPGKHYQQDDHVICYKASLKN